MIFYFLLGKCELMPYSRIKTLICELAVYAISLVTTINTRRQLAKGQETEGQDGHERTGALTFNPRGPPVTALRSQARQILSLASEKFESPESQIRVFATYLYHFIHLIVLSSPWKSKFIEWSQSRATIAPAPFHRLGGRSTSICSQTPRHITVKM